MISSLPIQSLVQAVAKEVKDALAPRAKLPQITVGYKWD